MPMPDTFNNILIIKPSALGDIALTLPAVRALQKAFPQARMTWLIRPEYADLVRNHPALDKVILFDRKRLANSHRSRAAWSGLRALFRELRNADFDAVFDFQGLFRTAFMARFTGAKYRFGMANARELAPLFYTHRIKPDPDSIHVIDHYMQMVKAAGAEDLSVEFHIAPDESAAKSVKHFLDNKAVDSNNYAILIPGSAHADKCWPAENFAAVTEKLAGKYQFDIIACGTKPEQRIIDEISSKTDTTIVSAAGQTELRELIELLRNAKLVISNDTGPGHIAVALNKPLVMLFGWSNPARIYPYQRPETIAAIEPFDRGTRIVSRDPKHAVTHITVDTIWQKIQEQLDC